MRQIVIDIETSVDSTHKAGKAFPFDPANKVVAIGLRDIDLDKGLGGTGTKLWYLPSFGDFYANSSFTGTFLGGGIAPYSTYETPTLIAGHNIAFDLLYLLRDFNDRKDLDAYTNLVKFLREGVVWDTAIAEFYLSGGTHKFPSLDDVCIKRGYEVKDSSIKDHWDEGGRTEDIDQDKLMDYLQHDVEVTGLIAVEQLKEAEEAGMLDYLFQVMKSRQATIWMEFVGVYVANEAVDVEIKAQKLMLEDYLEMVRDSMADRFDLPPGEVNPESNKQLSIHFFGGEIEYEDRVPVMDPKTGKPYVYKSGAKKGQIKTRKEKRVNRISRLYEPERFGATPTKTPGIYTVGDKVLESLSGESLDAAYMREVRSLRKNISTYLEGYAGMAVNGLIHCNFNYPVVPTGRLSCSKPNMQNLTKEE